jgi:hypothetical protein
MTTGKGEETAVGEDDRSPRMKGSLRDALAAAAAPVKVQHHSQSQPQVPPPAPRESRAAPPPKAEHVHVEADHVSTRLVRSPVRRPGASDGAPLTQRLRGKIDVKRTEFHQDPVVGWLVVVGGPGLGAFRPIFEGNNTIGRNPAQRIPIDFGDEAISGEEQAYIRYDSVDRKFLLVPNMAKTNIVAVNDRKPTSAVVLAPMDLITMGRTQLCFVPFCGHEFDWAELNELKA